LLRGFESLPIVIAFVRCLCKSLGRFIHIATMFGLSEGRSAQTGGLCVL
jgi:hypothetical protein